MKNSDRIVNIVLVLMLIAGLCLLLYPTVSDWWNSMHSSQAITAYTEQLSTADPEECARILQQVYDYNLELLDRRNPFVLSSDQRGRYYSLLDTSDNGIMGYIEIPTADILLPIYHGTSEVVLKKGVGHLEWSTMPVGGPGTHSVLSGHRGLPSAKLFTNLDRVIEGDIFMIRVLDQVLTYEVDQILIVEPQDVSSLFPEQGKDYCSLVTCTPYGINTHRMIVRGHRIENAEITATYRVTSEGVQIEPLLVAVVIGTPVLLILMFIVLAFGGKTDRKGEEDE